jgi:hypothetical protein
MLLIFVPIPQFSNFLLLIAPNSIAETSFAVSWTGHYRVACWAAWWGASKLWTAGDGINT